MVIWKMNTLQTMKIETIIKNRLARVLLQDSKTNQTLSLLYGYGPVKPGKEQSTFWQTIETNLTANDILIGDMNSHLEGRTSADKHLTKLIQEGKLIDIGKDT